MQRHHQRNHRHRQRSSPDGDVPKFYNSGLKDAVGKGDIILLRDAARLRENTRTKGQYESALKEILLEKNLMAWYEAVPLKIPSANGGVFRGDTYPPDFFTAIFVNGKQDYRGYGYYEQCPAICCQVLYGALQFHDDI